MQAGSFPYSYYAYTVGNCMGDTVETAFLYGTQKLMEQVEKIISMK